MATKKKSASRAKKAGRKTKTAKRTAKRGSAGRKMKAKSARKAAPKRKAAPRKRAQSPVARVQRVTREVVQQATEAVTTGVETLKDLGQTLVDRVRSSNEPM